MKEGEGEEGRSERGGRWRERGMIRKGGKREEVKERENGKGKGQRCIYMNNSVYTIPYYRWSFIGHPVINKLYIH